jgi:hypothetical protein
MVSAVVKDVEPGMILVRARTLDDLTRFLGTMINSAEIIETPNNDYRFRIRVPIEIFTSSLVKQAGGIDYPNFKASIDRSDVQRQTAYHNVWEAMTRIYGAYGDKGRIP